MTPWRGYGPLYVKNSVFVVKHSNFFSSGRAAQIQTKFGLVLLYGILHRTDVGIFDSTKNMAAMAKIEHRGKLQFFANNSKMATDIKIMTEGKSVQHLKIYRPWNFQEDPTTDVGVIALFLIFPRFRTYLTLYLENCTRYLKSLNYIWLSTSRSSYDIIGSKS